MIFFRKQRVERALEVIQRADTTSEERQKAARELGRIGTGERQVIDVLLRVWESSRTDADLCEIAAYALGNVGVGDMLVIERAIRVLEAPDGDDDFRGDAVDILQAVGSGNGRAVAALRRSLDDSRHSLEMRVLIADALAIIASEGTPENTYAEAFLKRHDG